MVSSSLFSGLRVCWITIIISSDALIVPQFGQWTPFKLASVSYDKSSSFFENFFVSWHNIFQIHLVYVRLHAHTHKHIFISMTYFVYRKLRVHIHTFYSCPTPTSQGLYVYLPFLIMRDIIIPNMFAYLIYHLEHNWYPFSSLPPSPPSSPLLYGHSPHHHTLHWMAPPVVFPHPDWTLISMLNYCLLGILLICSCLWPSVLPILYKALTLCVLDYPCTWLPPSLIWTRDTLLLLFPCMDPFLSYLDSGTLLWALQLPSLSYCQYRSPSRSIPNRFRIEFGEKEGKEKGGSEIGGRRVSLNFWPRKIYLT